MRSSSFLTSNFNQITYLTDTPSPSRQYNEIPNILSTQVRNLPFQQVLKKGQQLISDYAKFILIRGSKKGRDTYFFELRKIGAYTTFDDT